MARMKGKWQRGTIDRLSADQFREVSERASIGVKKPTAIEQQKNKWRIYHKPIGQNENWD